MNLDIKAEETHQKTFRTLLSKSVIEQIILEAVTKFANINLTSAGITYKIDFQDETEGSPAYKVETRAIVIITQNLMPIENGW